jgi:hypothetical protein
MTLGWKILVYFMAIWYFYCHFGIFYGHLVFLWTFWYIFFHFGMLYQEKSGNPAQELFFVLVYRHCGDVRGHRRGQGIDLTYHHFGQKLFGQTSSLKLWTNFHPNTKEKKLCDYY